MYFERQTRMYSRKKSSLPLQYNLLLAIMRQRRARSPDPRKKILLKIRVTRLCARRSRTPGLFQLSRNYCPSALRSSVNIFPFMPWFLAKGAQRSGFLHGRATTHWLKIITHRLQRGHLPATRCPLSFSRPLFLRHLLPPSSFSFSSPTLRLLIYLALVPTKAKQAAAAEFTVEETWQTN